MAGRTYHLRRKRSADLPPMEALRRDARPVRRGVVVRPGIVALAPGVTEMRGQTGLAVSPTGSGRPYLDSIRLQRAEAREMERGVDEIGRSRRERAAWASVLRGFAVELALLAALPAGAVTLVEPTTVQGTGAPLAGANALLACAYWMDGQPVTYWLPASSPGGGGMRALPEPTDTRALPRRYVARCVNAAGWGPAITGTLELRLTVP